jgi:hypothetical protein
MQRNVFSIKDQKLSALLLDFYICESCGTVDRNWNRMCCGYPCPICKVPSKAGRLYYHSNVRDIVNIMQTQYHFKGKKEKLLLNKPATEDQSHKALIPILFCTLWEILLDHFFCELMRAMKLSANVKERLLEDNKYTFDRTGKLFKSLTNLKWKDAIEKVSEIDNADYLAVNSFYCDVNKMRNIFIHRGSDYISWTKMPEECLKKIYPSAQCFVALHNLLIPDINKKNYKKNQNNGRSD